MWQQGVYLVWQPCGMVGTRLSRAREGVRVSTEWSRWAVGSDRSNGESQREAYELGSRFVEEARGRIIVLLSF